MGELTYRARRILYATVTEYIASGEPVGSRKLAKRYGINLSPATIRNVLSDLEDDGFLAQPHTSAGRVPTTLGFRVFVDALVHMREVGAEDRAAVIHRLQNLPPGTDVLKVAGEVLSSLTGAAAVVSPPKPEEERLAQLRFMPLREGQLLAILVTKSGAVQNRVVTVPDGFENKSLERINNILEELLSADGSSLVAIKERLASGISEERGLVQQLRVQARHMVEQASKPSTTSEVLIEGQGRLFDRPEFLDGEKIRSYLRAFDDRERLVTLLEETLASGGVRVLIGSEAGLDVEDVTLISSSFGRSGASAGSLAVIGPTRMDYAKVVPIVEFTAKVMTEVLAGDDEDV